METLPGGGRSFHAAWKPFRNAAAPFHAAWNRCPERASASMPQELAKLAKVVVSCGKNLFLEPILPFLVARIDQIGQSNHFLRQEFISKANLVIPCGMEKRNPEAPSLSMPHGNGGVRAEFFPCRVESYGRHSEGRMARALFSFASMISRSPGPLSLMPQRWRMPWMMVRCNSSL